MKALILAAGEGTRLRPLTLQRPKPMLPVGGRPLLEYGVDLLRRHGITEIAINVHYKPETIQEYFGDGARWGVSIVYSPEETLLGSAGGAKQLEWFLTETFVLLYGDVLTDIDLGELAGLHHRSPGAAATNALYEVADPTRCGIADVDQDGRIHRFVEKPTPAEVFSNLAYAGISIIEPSVLRDVPAGRPYDYGTDLIPRLLAQDVPLYGFRVPGYVLDVGSPERYEQARQDVAAGRLQVPGHNSGDSVAAEVSPF